MLAILARCVFLTYILAHYVFLTFSQVLTKRHVINAVHHFTIHGVHSKHPAAMGVVRLAERWVGAHMLSGLIPHEAIELLVASVFTDSSPLHTPSTVSCGFMRFLSLVASYDWRRYVIFSA